jgi:hypothetical protein
VRISFRYTWLSLKRSSLPHDAHKTCLGRRTFTSTPSLLADITLTVDGKEVTVPQGILRDLYNSLVCGINSFVQVPR